MPKNITTMAQKILTLALLVSLAMVQTAFAQVAGAPMPPAVDTTATPATAAATTPAAPAPDTTYIAPTDPAPAPAAPSINPQATVAPVQDTTNTQPAVTGSQLENTANPAVGTSTVDVGSLIPLVNPATTTATTTDPTPVPVSSASTSLPATPIDTGSTTVEVAASIDATPAVPAVQTIVNVITVTQVLTSGTPLVSAPEDTKYDFGVTGKTIPSKKKIKNAAGDVIGETTVTNAVTPTVDSVNNALTVSGQCSDKYYVVLLYKNQNDYDTDPRSYIFNSAFPCANGAYSYAISDLPSTLTDGKYYLLIGSQDDTHPWVPITGVTEITINRATKN
jgi:hypothetical protein